MTTTNELLATLRARGVVLEPAGDKLRYAPADVVAPELREAIRQHKAALLALLTPARTPGEEDCPDHWRHIPVLPPKNDTAPTTDDDGKPARYRVCLFGVWHLIRFKPDISPTHIATVDSNLKCRMFANLHELYRFCWAEHYAPALHYREVN